MIVLGSVSFLTGIFIILFFYNVSANLKNAVNSIHKDINYNNISGSTILLSPAAASFDQFRNFEDRGVYFRKLIKQKFKKN